MKKFNIFCKHNNLDVICWHWTHGQCGSEIRFLEIQVKCKNCNKYLFKEIRNWEKCYKFIKKYKNKEWSSTCHPVL